MTEKDYKDMHRKSRKLIEESEDLSGMTFRERAKDINKRRFQKTRDRCRRREGSRFFDTGDFLFIALYFLFSAPITYYPSPNPLYLLPYTFYQPDYYLKYQMKKRNFHYQSETLNSIDYLF
jgi:hypothetical protein